MARKPNIKTKTVGQKTTRTSTVNGRTSTSVSVGKRGGPRITQTTRKDGSYWRTYSDGLNTYTKKASGKREKKASTVGGLILLGVIGALFFFLKGIGVLAAIF